MLHTPSTNKVEKERNCQRKKEIAGERKELDNNMSSRKDAISKEKITNKIRRLKAKNKEEI